MTGILIKVAIFAAIAIAIYLGARRIWRDWRGQFKKLDEAVRQRDRRERARPDVVTLRRSDDGVFRPTGRDEP